MCVCVCVHTSWQAERLVPEVKGRQYPTLSQVSPQLRVVGVVGCKGQLVGGGEDDWAGGGQEEEVAEGTGAGEGGRGGEGGREG